MTNKKNLSDLLNEVRDLEEHPTRGFFEEPDFGAWDGDPRSLGSSIRDAMEGVY